MHLAQLRAQRNVRQLRRACGAAEAAQLGGRGGQRGGALAEQREGASGCDSGERAEGGALDRGLELLVQRPVRRRQTPLARVPMTL